MKVLLGWPEGDAMDLWRGSQDRSLFKVDDADTFRHKLNIQFDAVIVHVDLFRSHYPWNWLPFIRQEQPDAKIIIVTSDKTYDGLYLEVIIAIAGDLGMQLVHQGLSISETKDSLAQLLGGEVSETLHSSGGELLTIVSCSPRDGATAIAAQTALTLANSTSLRIGLLDLNLKAPGIVHSLNVPGNGRDIFHLRPACIAGTLSPKQLIDGCVRYRTAGQLYVLPGSHRRDVASDYTIEHMQTLLTAARGAFDVVIADVHAFPDNAATVYAVKHANERWLVTQPSVSSYRAGWNDWYECVWRHCGMHRDDFRLIVNRYDHREPIEAEALASSAGLSLLGKVANVGEVAGRRAVREAIPLGFLEQGIDFHCDVQSIVTDYAQRTGISLMKSPLLQRQGSIRKWMLTMFLNGGLKEDKS